MEELIISNISNFGFPAVVCFYLMFRVVRSVDNNTNAIENLRNDINRLIQTHHL